MGILKSSFKIRKIYILIPFYLLVFGCNSDEDCDSIYKSISTIDIMYKSDADIEPYIFEMHREWINPIAGLKLAEPSKRKVYLEKYGNILLNKSMLNAKSEDGIADIEFLLKNGTNIYPIDENIKKTVENAIANAAAHNLVDVLNLLTPYSNEPEKIKLAKNYIQCKWK